MSRGWLLIASQMRIDQALFTGLVYVSGTGSTLCNAGVTLCTRIRGVRHEILACVSPLMTLFSSWFQLLLFDFLVNYAESVTFTTSLLSPDYDFWHDSDTDEWILCFVFINCFRLISRSQSELNTLDWSLWSLVSTMYLSLTVWLFNFRSLYEWELLFYT